VFGGRNIGPDAGKIDECINRASGRKAAAVLVGHSHFDHLLDAPEFAKKTGAVLAGSESTANAGRGAGLPEEKIRVIKNGDSLDIGAFSVRFVEGVHGPAFLGRIPYPGVIDRPLHPPARAADYRLGGFFGMVISHPLGTFIHHGSAGWIPGMYSGVKADTVFLCLAGRKDTCRYIWEVVITTGAEKVVPIHHDSFFSPLDAPLKPLPGVRIGEFIESMMLNAPDAEVGFPPLMKEFEIF
jgi:L-ascorbate metabolism protein UlaG (beta-lactamase superfamily)